MKMKRRHQQKLIVVAVALFFLWNIPFLSIWDKNLQLLGFPVFYVYIFLTWLLAVVLCYIVLNRFYE